MTALWLRTTLRKQPLGHPRAMPGVWGRFARHRILPRKEFMGRALNDMYFECPSLALQACDAGPFRASRGGLEGSEFRTGRHQKPFALEVTGCRSIMTRPIAWSWTSRIVNSTPS